MSLPKWINKTKPFDTHDDGLLILEALKIAWEALADVKTIRPHESNHVPPRLCSNCLITDALRRIDALGDRIEGSIAEIGK